jgi:hypothetical protein
MQIDVRVNIEEAVRRIGWQLKDEINKAVPTTLNRVATSARVTAVGEINKITGLKRTAIRKRLPISRATRAVPEAKITALPYAPNLRNFDAYEVKEGVSAKAWNVRKVYRGAFIGNKDRTVFTRVDYRPPSGQKRRLGQHTRKAHNRTRNGKTFNVAQHTVGSGARKPRSDIRPLFGPSVPRTFIQDTVNRSIRKTIDQKWPIEFERQIAFRLSKI